LLQNTASWQVCLSKDAFRRRLEGVERENLNSPARLRASHEWMGDVSTIQKWDDKIPEATKLHRHFLHRIPLNQMNLKKL
jgi:hypothetical protein